MSGICIHLSHEVMAGSEITPCMNIEKPLVVYIFLGNVMTSKTTLRTDWQTYDVFTTECYFKVILINFIFFLFSHYNLYGFAQRNNEKYYKANVAYRLANL